MGKLATIELHVIFVKNSKFLLCRNAPYFHSLDLAALSRNTLFCVRLNSSKLTDLVKVSRRRRAKMQKLGFFAKNQSKTCTFSNKDAHFLALFVEKGSLISPHSLWLCMEI